MHNIMTYTAFMFMHHSRLWESHYVITWRAWSFKFSLLVSNSLIPNIPNLRLHRLAEQEWRQAQTPCSARSDVAERTGSAERGAGSLEKRSEVCAWVAWFCPEKRLDLCEELLDPVCIVAFRHESSSSSCESSRWHTWSPRVSTSISEITKDPYQDTYLKVQQMFHQRKTWHSSVAAQRTRPGGTSSRSPNHITIHVREYSSIACKPATTLAFITTCLLLAFRHTRKHRIPEPSRSQRSYLHHSSLLRLARRLCAWIAWSSLKLFVLFISSDIYDKDFMYWLFPFFSYWDLITHERWFSYSWRWRRDVGDVSEGASKYDIRVLLAIILRRKPPQK